MPSPSRGSLLGAGTVLRAYKGACKDASPSWQGGMRQKMRWGSPRARPPTPRVPTEPWYVRAEWSEGRGRRWHKPRAVDPELLQAHAERAGIVLEPVTATAWSYTDTKGRRSLVMLRPLERPVESGEGAWLSEWVKRGVRVFVAWQWEDRTLTFQRWRGF